MKAIILSAGHGKRMKSKLPKALHPIMGVPILHRVIESCLGAGVDDITVVIGQGGEEIQKATPHNVRYAWQHEQLGTGHAVLCAKEFILPDDQVLVLCGDTPLITPDFLERLIKFQKRTGANGVVTSTPVPDPTGYGRVITKPSGEFEAIIEHRDLHVSQLHINHINPAVYLFTGRELLHGLELVGNDNNQKEYYLTDVPRIMLEDGFKVAVYHDTDYLQFLGINSQKQLAEAAAVMRSRIIDRHFENGVLILDPATVYIEDNVEIEAGVTLHPGVILNGSSYIAAGAVIGAYSVISDSRVGEGCTVGPFAHLRNGAVVGDNCRIGNFVEIKKSTIGNGTKAAHLAYIGDAEIGNNVNFSCGAITVNYDGRNKHLTVVEDDAFIGCNVNLVAPVTVRQGAFVAGGSTIVEEVPQDALAIARQRQTNKEGFAKKLKK